MATIFASTTGSGTVTYAQAQNRTTPATLARALALHLSGDRIECELGTYGAIGSGLLGGTDSSHKTTLATVDLGASGKAKFQVADGSTPVFVPTHNNIALENLELTHGDAATRGTVGANMIETNNNVAAQNIDFRNLILRVELRARRLLSLPLRLLSEPCSKAATRFIRRKRPLTSNRQTRPMVLSAT
jgi:hypothetical protein